MDTRSLHKPRVAAFGYFAPSLVYYVGQPIERINRPEQVSQFFEQGGDAVVMLRARTSKNIAIACRAVFDSDRNAHDS